MKGAVGVYMTVDCSDRRPKHAKKFRHFSLTLALDPPSIRRGQKNLCDAVTPPCSHMHHSTRRSCPISFFVSHDRALCSQCGAPVGRGEVGARAILLRVSLVTLRCIFVSAQLMGRSA